MKLFATALTLFTLATSAQTQPDLSQANVALTQATQSVELDQKEFETIYRTEQVPDTCYRDEVQGTRTECHTEYDQQCSTRYEQQCRIENFPVCTTVPRNVCYPQQVCQTRTDRVCTPRGCVNVPRNECRTENRCTTQMDRVCRNESRQVCQTIPRQVRQTVPRNVCIQVPNVVRVPYACTRTVQVPDGQQLKMDTVAHVVVNFVNFNEVGSLNEQLVAKLQNGIVTLRPLNANSAYLFQVVGQQRTEQVISTNAKIIQYNFSVRAIPIAALNAMMNSSVMNPHLAYSGLQFNLMSSYRNLLKGHLKVVQYRGRRSGLILIDDDFGAKSLVIQGEQVNLMFAPFGVSSLYDATHLIELTLQLDTNSLQGLINPEAMNQVMQKTIATSFEARPN